jgi:hypothetical protein
MSPENKYAAAAKKHATNNGKKYAASLMVTYLVTFSVVGIVYATQTTDMLANDSWVNADNNANACKDGDAECSLSTKQSFRQVKARRAMKNAVIGLGSFGLATIIAMTLFAGSRATTTTTTTNAVPTSR